MIDAVKSFGKTALLAGIVLGSIYGIIQLVAYIGFFKVLTFLYLLLGFMVAWETRQTQGHRLWFLVIPLWLPVIVYGLFRRGGGLVKEMNEKIAEEETEKEFSDD